jgi:brefeldin A-inhibited guanine nucleotide-exchange protein
MKDSASEKKESVMADLDAQSVLSECSNEAGDDDLDIESNNIGSLGSLVDSVDAFDKKQKVKQELENGIQQFNKKPKNGISYLVYSGIIEPFGTDEDPTGQQSLQDALAKAPGQRPRLKGNPASIAEFLLKYTEGKVSLDKGQIGDYMGDGDQYNVDILHAYTELLDFTGYEIDDGIRYFLKEFRLPGEAQKVDRMMEKFAQVYHDQNPGIFDSPETAFVLSFSIIMLNTDLHNPNIKEDRKMDKAGFIRNNRGIASGRDLPPEYLMGIFDRIKSNAISLKEDDELRMAASRTRNTAGSVKAKRLAMQADMQKEAVDRLHNKRRTIKNVEPGAWMNNMYFTMTDMLSSRNADYVRPMFGLLWSPSLTVYDLLLRTAWSDDKIVDLCLQGLRFGIRVSGVFKMDQERQSYVTTLSNFACLDHSPDKYMQRLNVEAVKVVLSVAMSEGEHLRNSWSDVLNVVSEVARLFIIAETGGRLADQNLFHSPSINQQRRNSLGGNSSKNNSPGGRNTGGTSSGGMPVSANKAINPFGNSRSKDARAAKKMEELRLRRKEVEFRNAQLIASSINFQELERIFTSSTCLGQAAIVDFMECLSAVAKFELIGVQQNNDTNDEKSNNSSSVSSQQPRVFSLQKLVEMADYNMHIRPRVVWAKLWQHISSLFEDVGAHPNVLIAMYAIDSLKQLGVKFLERTELSHFQFQQVFMQPFEKIMNKNPTLEIRELVLSVINNIIQLRHSNIMSGWKVIFSVYSAAASDTSETLNSASFSAMVKLIEEHWELVYPNFVDIINCFASFAKNVHHEETSLGAVAQILRLTGKLIEGNSDIRCDEHGALVSPSAQQKQHGEEKENERTEEKIEVDNATKQFRFTDSADHSRVWFPILTCLANLVVDQRTAVRKAALYGLFQILNDQGHAFSPSLWELIFKGVLFPIFDDVRHSEELSENPKAGRFIKEWLDTTCQDALNMLVSLFETPERYSTLSFLLTDVMNLVRTCIVHPNKLLARKGVVCLQQLLIDAGRLFPEDVWDRVCTNMVSFMIICVLFFTIFSLY